MAESDKLVKGGGAGQVDQDLIGQLAAQAREQGLELTGEAGDDDAEDWVATNALALLARHTDQVVTALDAQAAALGAPPGPDRHGQPLSDRPCHVPAL